MVEFSFVSHQRKLVSYFEQHKFVSWPCLQTGRGVRKAHRGPLPPPLLSLLLAVLTPVILGQGSSRGSRIPLLRMVENCLLLGTLSSSVFAFPGDPLLYGEEVGS